MLKTCIKSIKGKVLQTDGRTDGRTDPHNRNKNHSIETSQTSQPHLFLSKIFFPKFFLSSTLNFFNYKTIVEPCIERRVQKAQLRQCFRMEESVRPDL